MAHKTTVSNSNITTTKSNGKQSSRNVRTVTDTEYDLSRAPAQRASIFGGVAHGFAGLFSGGLSIIFAIFMFILLWRSAFGYEYVGLSDWMRAISVDFGLDPKTNPALAGWETVDTFIGDIQHMVSLGTILGADNAWINIFDMCINPLYIPLTMCGAISTLFKGLLYVFGVISAFTKAIARFTTEGAGWTIVRDWFCKLPGDVSATFHTTNEVRDAFWNSLIQ